MSQGTARHPQWASGQSPGCEQRKPGMRQELGEAWGGWPQGGDVLQQAAPSWGGYKPGRDPVGIFGNSFRKMMPPRDRA